MIRFWLFDLDNTLVDTLHLKPLRDVRRWREVYTRIDSVNLFDGIGEMWRAVRERGDHVGVVLRRTIVS